MFGMHYSIFPLTLAELIMATASKTTDPTRTWFSRADLEAYDRLPDGWFDLHAVPYQVRNPRWRCDRLVGLRALESRVVGSISDPSSLHPEYRKLPLC